MSIRFTCPHCGIETNVSDEFVGQTGPCAGCGRMVTVQAPTSLGGPATPVKKSSSSSVLVVVLVVVGGLTALLFCGGVLAALLLPAVQSARRAAQRTSCSNNLKQIGLAMHNYHEVHGNFPPAYVTDEDGNPMHSWRVLLLPYLEGGGLYDMYDMDEPWDGPNNSVLADMMPEVYRCPSDVDASFDSQTNYVVLTGKGAVFDGDKAATIDDMAKRAGPSNMLLVVEVSGSGINWLQPDDLPLDDWNKPGGPFGNGSADNHPGRFNALYGDGHVEHLSRPISLQELKQMSTIGSEDEPAEVESVESSGEESAETTE